MLDLHTKTAMIGREDSSVTLDALRLHEEAIDRVVDLYVVIREAETSTNQSYAVGLENLYMLTASWVLPLYPVPNLLESSGLQFH